MLYLCLIFLLGLMTPIQTAANSMLRQDVVSPLVASLVSFTIGTIFLLCVVLIEKGTVGFTTDIIDQLPWWAWMGGICGLYGLTVNILIFPKLGSVQTALMPMLGQIIAGMIIDAFGLFRAEVYSFSWMRLFALCFVLIGVCMVVFKGDDKQQGKHKWIWQLVGISGGTVFAMQPPMNSLLSASLSSAVHAAFFSFLSATIVLLLVVVVLKNNRQHLSSVFSLQRPWWSWLGGIIGGIFVTGFAYFAAKVGVGVLLVTSICGMLTCSLMLDKFGWLGAKKRPIGWLQYVGLLCVVAGIMILRLC